MRTLLRGAKTLGLHTAIASAGYLGCRVDDDHLALTDPWLLDLKSHVHETYPAATGVDTTPPLTTQPAASSQTLLRRTLRNHIGYTFRPAAPRYTTHSMRRPHVLRYD